MIEVAGGRLNVLDIGPRDAAGPPIVMIHGASSNLEAMRQPLGDRLASDHRVILIDRPGHGWSTRARLEDSTPAIQGRMIDEALEKLGVGSAIFVVHSWSGALGARMALDYPERVAGPRDAGAGGLSVAGRRRLVQQGRRHAGDRPAARLYDHAAARHFSGRARRARRIPAADHAAKFHRRYRDAVVAASARIPRQCPRSGDAEGGGRRAGAALRRYQGAGGGDFGRRRQDRDDQYPFAAVREGGERCQD